MATEKKPEWKLFDKERMDAILKEIARAALEAQKKHDAEPIEVYMNIEMVRLTWQNEVLEAQKAILADVNAHGRIIICAKCGVSFVPKYENDILCKNCQYLEGQLSF